MSCYVFGAYEKTYYEQIYKNIKFYSQPYLLLQPYVYLKWLLNNATALYPLASDNRHYEPDKSYR